MGDAGYDRQLTVFSPEGRLFQIEYAFKAAKSSEMTSVGVRGSECVVLATQKKVKDNLIDASFVTNIYKVTENLGAVMTGIAPDSRAMIQRARQKAVNFFHTNGYEMPVEFLAKKMADDNQIYTQYAMKRAFGVVSILGAVDEESGPQLFRVDPAGHYVGFKACAAGLKEQEATNWLEKRVQENAQADERTALHRAISCLQTVLGTDFRSDELEVAIIRKGERLNRLSENEIDGHLTAIAEEN
eukprot:gb/GECG01003707.1/.p1 GENE.gb/GECG01003707.1/~~gb/GECG01003707.1/.p1  ORF type:complete len:243 (+),score=40.62 gb/GECG01003707.1/:1-729(+)